MPTTPESGYLPTLDGWRAIAIAGVCTAHGGVAAFGPGDSPAFPDAFAVTRFGAKGVDLFFAISGFLITSRLLDEFHRTGRIDLLAFYIRRSFRILPPLFALLIFIALGEWAGLWMIGTADWITSVTFTRNYMPEGNASYFTGHLWSLSVEEHFYLVWPLFLAVIGPRRPLFWALAITAVLAVWATVEFRMGFVERLIPGVGYYVRTDISLNKILSGASAALAVRYYPLAVRRVLRPWAVLPILAGLTAVIALRPPLATTAESLLFAALITATVLHPKTIVGRCLEWSLLRWIGRLSYSLYLWQQLFLVPVGADVVILQRLPWNGFAVLGCATASRYLIERPMIELGRRFVPSANRGRRSETDGDAVACCP